PAHRPLPAFPTRRSSDLMRRDAVIERLASRELDVLVIGGGIVGAGVAATAARAGLDVGLVDKGDFGGATSTASSKLIHGGLRYLDRKSTRLNSSHRTISY